MNKLLKPLEWIENSIAVISMTTVSLLVFANVVSRYGFSYTPIWSEELSRFLVVWSIFIGVSIGVRKNQHIGVDALIRFLPHKLLLAAEVLLNLIGVVVIGILIYTSIDFIKETIEYGQLSPAMRIPMYIPYIAMPVGLSLSIIHFINNIVQLLIDPTKAEAVLFASEHVEEIMVEEEMKISGGDKK
ncbi:MAG: TRAP transporter small permease [Deltaproteobacteria bacterium]|nr:TRAP transporter small permease [Deltaproteobacteria bacterium]